MINTSMFEYKDINGVKLSLRVYYPEKCVSDYLYPAIIFYFGGGWQTGDIDHFASQSIYFATKGFVSITPEYRIESKHHTTPFECVEDAKDAFEWVIEHSDEMGIDSSKITVAGGSAGGHLAACTAILRSEKYDTNHNYRIPNAMVLFNPVCDTSENGYGYNRLGERKLEISPIHHIRDGLPPTLFFHGTADKIVPYNNAINFCNRMKELGNKCYLVTYEGRGHGFFNKCKSENDNDYWDALYKMEAFLEAIS